MWVGVGWGGAWRRAFNAAAPVLRVCHLLSGVLSLPGADAWVAGSAMLVQQRWGWRRSAPGECSKSQRDGQRTVS